MKYQDQYKLKRCPFCGDRAEFDTEPIGMRSVWWYVKCIDCTASVNASTQVVAAKRWNDRCKDDTIECPDCNSINTTSLELSGANQGKYGEDVGVSVYTCLDCGEEWSD